MELEPRTLGSTLRGYRGISSLSSILSSYLVKKKSLKTFELMSTSEYYTTVKDEAPDLAEC